MSCSSSRAWGSTRPSPLASRAYADNPEMWDSSFSSPVYQTAIAHFPEAYFPELLGMTLYLEWEAIYLPAMVKLYEYHGYSSLFYKLHVAIDMGKEWTNVSAKLPTPNKWVSKVLASKYAECTVYLTQQGRYDDDFNVYIFRTDDYGATWKSASGDLPRNNGSVRVVREDPVNTNLLFAGSEFGAYVSFDRGEHWSLLAANLPTVDHQPVLVLG